MNNFYRYAHSNLLLLSLLLAGCGGGGGGGNGNNNTPTPDPDPDPIVITDQDLMDAARLSSRASFGMPYEALEPIARQGYEAWLDQQLNTPASLNLPIVLDLFERRENGEFDAFENNVELLFTFRRLAWWHNAVNGDDQLRQRVAFALSEIFVVSDQVAMLRNRPDALSSYQDMLLEGAFGNFRDLLEEVTLHPAMGVFLSHLNNSRSDAEKNTFPDENYAREVMQLFSIGLFELNNDGSVITDTNNQPVATYDNDDIREFAKVFTGLSWGGDGAFFGKRDPEFTTPMMMFDEAHEPGVKMLLNGAILADGQTGQQDLEMALDNLFEHPNVGPFIGKQLIQRLVTSNPSPAYIERVTNTFNDNGNGVRGDMQAVIKAILLDQEAIASPAMGGNFGKLQEPIVRFASLARQLNATSNNEYFDNFFASSGYVLQFFTQQHPLSAPSVFNFFLPSHTPAGAIADAGLVAPEFQITTSTSIIGVSNLLDLVLSEQIIVDADEPFADSILQLDDYIDLSEDIPALINRLDIVFTAGTMSSETRNVIENAINETDNFEFRTIIALYLTLISADAAVTI